MVAWAVDSWVHTVGWECLAGAPLSGGTWPGPAVGRNCPAAGPPWAPPRRRTTGPSAPPRRRRTRASRRSSGPATSGETARVTATGQTAAGRGRLGWGWTVFSSGGPPGRDPTGPRRPLLLQRLRGA